MKLDMERIGKLTPPGLLEVWGVLRLVQHLITALDIDAPSNAASLKTARFIGRLLRQLRESEAYNLNLRVRMWVLQNAARRAWVRDMIGEQAISRWHKRYDMLSITDSGLGTSPRKIHPTKPTTRINNNANTHTYRHRQFALPRLVDRSAKSFKTFANFYISPIISPIQFYTITRHKPTEFWPHELCPNYSLSAQDMPKTSRTQNVGIQKSATTRITVRLRNRPSKVKIPPSLYQYLTPQDHIYPKRSQQGAKKLQWAQQIPCGP